MPQHFLSESLPGASIRRPRRESSVTVNGVSPGAGTGINADLSLSHAYMLLKLHVSHACWVRIYTDDDSRTADLSRNIDADPDPEVGLVAEFVSTGEQTIRAAPAVLGFNENDPASSICPIRISNLEESSQNITVTATFIVLE